MRALAALLAVALTLPGAGQFSNRRAPGFSLADSKFRQHDPQDYRGKLLVIDIMVTSCPTCNALADVLVKVKEKYGDRVAMISVVTAPDTFADMDAFAAKHGITWPMVYDSGQMMASYLDVTPGNPTVHFPHLFVVDGDGMIRSDFEAADDKLLTVEGLSVELDRLLAPKTRL